jgi:hypothetical protein
MADPAGPGKLILVGLSGLDWKSFDARTSNGSLPKIAALRARGVCGKVRARGAQSEASDFATLATGVHPEAHRVWMAQEPWEGGVRPLSRASWRTAPLWARLAAAGVGAGSVAWPGSRPGASWPGTHIDDSLLEASAWDPVDWALPRAAAPMAARAALRDRRVHPTDISADILRGFVPALDRIDQSEDAMLPMLALAIAETATAQAAAAWLLTEAPGVSAAFIHHRWLQRIRTMFERARGPGQAEIVEGAWRFLDGLVSGLASLATPGARLLLVSPGWEGEPGVFLGLGQGLETSPAHPDIELVDIAPAVLAHFGLVDASLCGRAPPGLRLPTALRPAPTVEPDAPVIADPALIRQLAEAGVDLPPPASPAWRAMAEAALAAQVLDRAPKAAAEIARAALAIDPLQTEATRLLAAASLRSG